MLNGEQPRVVMEAMRHSDLKLTMKLYTDAGQLPVGVALARLPWNKGGQERRGRISMNVSVTSTEQGGAGFSQSTKKLNDAKKRLQACLYGYPRSERKGVHHAYKIRGTRDVKKGSDLLP